MLLLQQSGVLLAFSDPGAHCLLSLLPTRTPRAISVDLLPSQSVPSLYHCQGLFVLKSSSLFLAVFLAEFYQVLFGHSFLPGQVPLKDGSSVRYQLFVSEFGILCKCDRHVFHPLLASWWRC